KIHGTADFIQQAWSLVVTGRARAGLTVEQHEAALLQTSQHAGKGIQTISTDGLQRLTQNSFHCQVPAIASLNLLCQAAVACDALLLQPPADILAVLGQCCLL